MLIFDFKQGWCRYFSESKQSMRILFAFIPLFMAVGCGSNKPTSLESSSGTAADSSQQPEPWFCQASDTDDQWDCVRSATLAASPKPSRLPSSQPKQSQEPESALFEATDPPPASTPTAAGQPSGPQPSEPQPLYRQLSYQPDKPAAILDLPEDFYAVQLVALSSKESLEQYAREHKLAGMSAARIWSDDQLFYILLLGIYETKVDAERAADSLSGTLAAVNPWIRTLGSLQRAMVEAETQAGVMEP